MMHMKLELIPVPVTDIDRAKAFYVDQVGFLVDVDMSPTDGVRIVQLTPPGSACSILLSVGLPKQQRTTRIVKDVPAAEVAREIAAWIRGS